MNWEQLKDILLNTWTLTILTGVISSVIAHFCISLYSRKKANKLLQQKILSANGEILNAMRLIVSDKGQPPIGLLRSLINSAARKYSLKTDDLYTPEIIIEELEKEILENMFLSTSEKLSLCKDLDKQVVRNDPPVFRNNYDYKTSNKIMFSSMMIAIITMLFFLLFFKRDSDAIQIYIITLEIFLLIFAIYRIIKVRNSQKEVSLSSSIDEEHISSKSNFKNEILLQKLDELDIADAWKKYMEMGVFYANQQKNQLSAQYYEKAIKIFPLSNKDNNAIGKLYILRGGVLKRLGTDYFKDALLAINKGLELVDDNHIKGDAYYNLACIYAKQDNRELFNEVINQQLKNLDKEEEEEVLNRLNRWLKKNAANYSND